MAPTDTSTHRLARVLATAWALLRDALSLPAPWCTPITLATWGAFQAELGRELARLEVGTKVVIEATGDRCAYVQFAREAESLYAEAASMRFPQGERRLSAEQEQRLAEAGWRSPDQRHPNWWFDRPLPLAAADYERVGALAVLAFREGLQIAAPSSLGYRAWKEVTRARLPMEVDLPTLRPDAG